MSGHGESVRSPAARLNPECGARVEVVVADGKRQNAGLHRFLHDWEESSGQFQPGEERERLLTELGTRDRFALPNPPLRPMPPATHTSPGQEPSLPDI